MPPPGAVAHAARVSWTFVRTGTARLKTLREKVDTSARMAEKQARTRHGVGPEAFDGRKREPRGRREGGLHICPGCDSELVYPVDWEPANARQWTVGLRCPECEWRDEGVFTQDVVDRFDEVLEIGTAQILDDLNLLVRANIEEQVDRFVAALQADQILAEDF